MAWPAQALRVSIMLLEETNLQWKHFFFFESKINIIIQGFVVGVEGERGEWGHPCVQKDGWPSKRPRI